MFFLPKKAAQKNARTTENRGGPQLRALTDAVGADGLDGAGAGVRGSDPRSPGAAGTTRTRPGTEDDEVAGARPGSEADRWRRRLAGVGGGWQLPSRTPSSISRGWLGRDAMSCAVLAFMHSPYAIAGFILLPCEACAQQT